MRDQVVWNGTIDRKHHQSEQRAAPELKRGATGEWTPPGRVGRQKEVLALLTQHPGLTWKQLCERGEGEGSEKINGAMSTLLRKKTVTGRGTRGRRRYYVAEETR